MLSRRKIHCHKNHSYFIIRVNKNPVHNLKQQHILHCQSRNTRVTRQMPLVEQELLTVPKHLSSAAGFSGLGVAQSLVFCVVFRRSLFVLFILPLYCLSFDLWFLITPLVSASLSNKQRNNILTTINK